MHTTLITGGTSGLGFATANVLAQKGLPLIITSPNLERAKEAANTINRRTQSRNVTGLCLDLASQTSIRKFATQIVHSQRSLSAIVCNAGITLNGPTQYTEEGIEKVFGVNHLGHFLLVNLLLKHLERPARIVFVSSGTHIPDHKLARRTGMPIPVYTSARELAYSKDAKGGRHIQSLRYTTSKLCNVLCAQELARRVVRSGLSTADAPIGVYSIDPGLIPGTGLTREFPRLAQTIFTAIVSALSPYVEGIRSAEASAHDVARLLTDPALHGVTGTYYDGQKEVPASPVAYELDKARDLWETSAELVGLSEKDAQSFNRTSRPAQPAAKSTRP